MSQISNSNPDDFRYNNARFVNTSTNLQNKSLIFASDNEEIEKDLNEINEKINKGIERSNLVKK